MLKTDMLSSVPTMFTVDHALKCVLEHIASLPSEELTLTEVLGRVLSEDIYADINIPLVDNSAMDGYAVHAGDIGVCSPDKPATLNVVGDVRAGQVSPHAVGAGEAVRVMTGAPVPRGADAVVMVENTEKNGAERVQVFRSVTPGENIRRAGEDLKPGELVLEKGSILGSAHIGILASLGRSRVKVTRKPRVAILVTGDEVIDVNDKIEPGKLRSSNTYTLYSQIIQAGGIPKNLGIARDRPEELEAKIAEGLDCDLMLTSGGVSVGDYDLVKYILVQMGTDIKFWKVAIKPGKPLVFGIIKGVPIFGLPGNPVSSMIGFEVFVRPAILKMLGIKEDPRKQVDAVLEEDITKKKGLRYFLRADTRWEDGVYLTRTTGPQGSGILKSMARANSLMDLPEDTDFIAKGIRITVRFLD